MSIAAISSSFVAAARESAAVPPIEAAAAPRAATTSHREGGRRHELVDAMQQVLGIDGEPNKAEAQVVFRFAHALMHDLRSIDAGAAREGPGRGHAWGRRSWSDLPQRIDTLATATATAASEATVIHQAAVADSAVLAQPELPPQPNPVTTTSAAVHLMQVPTSRLLEAFAALRMALGKADSADDTPAPPVDERSELAAFLQRLSDGLGKGAPASVPAGCVVNLTA